MNAAEERTQAVAWLRSEAKRNRHLHCEGLRGWLNRVRGSAGFIEMGCRTLEVAADEIERGEHFIPLSKIGERKRG